jgi:hypothetical protein
MPDHGHPARSLMTRLRDRFARRGTIRYDPGTHAIVFTPGGLRVRALPVDAVARVEAGNRDTVRDESVCLFFHVDGEPTLAVSESDPGFGALVRDLGQAFPGIEAWEQAIPPVAFQLTSVELWRRDPSPTGATTGPDHA